MSPNTLSLGIWAAVLLEASHLGSAHRGCLLWILYDQAIVLHVFEAYTSYFKFLSFPRSFMTVSQCLWH
jgi:hypothetical protein